MIDSIALGRFLSGRLLGLVASLGLQVAIVRLLPPAAYASYALVIALAALLQTVTSIGVPRVIAKFVSGAGEGLTRRAARTLALALLTARFMACLLMTILAALAVSLLDPVAAAGFGPLLFSGAAYAIASALLIDADGLAQALKLQIASRRAAIGEPLTRLTLVLGIAFGGGDRDVVVVVWISAATAAAAATMLIGMALRSLSTGPDAPGASGEIDWKRVRRVAFGGYGGTLSWLAFSPAVIRLIAARILPTEMFAGFSFVQTLAVSAQRYAPSFTLFPLIEPAAMADAARTGRPDRLRAALSLLVKVDAVLVGAAIIGLSAAGAPIVLLLTHGRYGGAAAFLPWLMAGIVANASHRSYEIAAVALDVADALILALGLTLAWLAAALLAAPVLGVWPLLLFPLGDALTRLWLVQRALTRQGAPGVIDHRGVSLIGVAVATTSFAAASAANALHAGLVGGVSIGLAGGLAFLLIVATSRPIRSSEVSVLTNKPWLLDWLARRRRGAAKALRVMVLTPRGRGGTGGVDRLMDALRPLLGARTDVSVTFVTTRGRRLLISPLTGGLALVRLAVASAFRQVDMIHVNLGAYGGCYRKMALIALPRLCGTPYVLHLHGSAFEDFWLSAPAFWRRRIDRLFFDAAQVIVLGDAGRDLISSRVPEAALRTSVLANATAAIEKQMPAGEGVQILFLGELGPRKGSPILIEALGRLGSQTSWRAVIAGNGDVATAQCSIDRLGLSERVRLPGWIGPGEVKTMLATSDILVLPSFEETLPMAVVEAFAAGLAVIATPVGALPGILKSGETGLMVAPGDVEGLARALDALIGDAGLRERLGAAAKAYHTAHLDLSSHTDRLIQLWRATDFKNP